MPSVFKVHVIVGELNVKIQCCTPEGFTIKKKYFIGMFPQPVESENQLHSERQKKNV